MKKYQGLILILVTFLLTYIFWLFETPEKSLSLYRRYSQFISSIALIALTWINFIATRHHYVDDFFNGLDISYIYHKYLSILIVFLIWAHNFTLKMGGFSGKRPTNFKSLPKGVKPSGAGMFFSGKQLGTFSLYLFTGLVIIFLVLYKLEYENWKKFHTIMIVPYILGVLHYYLSSEYKVFSLSAFSLWMNLFNLIGVLSIIYSIFIYEFVSFKHKYKVTSINEIAKDTFEITGTSLKNELKYKAGQFAFIKIPEKKSFFPSHPFTMSNSNKSNEIQFSIKVLGDHTKALKENLKVGDTLSVSGPHGKFNYENGLKHQIWIAGGIGITPFRSFWQAELPSDYTVDLFYTYNNENEGAYINELNSINKNSNLNIHSIDSSKNGFLGLEDLEKHIDKNLEYSVFFCGPKPMREKLRRDFEKVNFKIKEDRKSVV